MKVARWIAVLATASLFVAGRAAATGGLQPGDTCSVPGEPSFVCGFVFVTIEAGTEISAVVQACQPVGEAVEVRPNKFRVDVPVGSEIALRDCYRAQPGVSQAELGLQGMVNSAMPEPGGAEWAAWLARGLIATALLLACISVRRQSSV
jgi:hypothetical protein